MASAQEQITVSRVIDALKEARERTQDLVADLNDEQLIGPRLGIVNPLRWEVGHVAYFQEYWVLRHFHGRPPLLDNGDALYDSAKVAHDSRWDLPLPSTKKTLAYMQEVLDRVVDLVSRGASSTSLAPGPAAGVLRPNAQGHGEAYFLMLALLHECMHAEAITYTRQTLGYPAPKFTAAQSPAEIDRSAVAAESEAGNRSEALSFEPGDSQIPGGEFMLGSAPGSGFIFDNEQWEHRIGLEPFAMARTAVTNEEYLAFVEEGGYRRREFWCEDGWRWRESAGAMQPLYWMRDSKYDWLRRDFDRQKPLEPRHPVLHVNWYEASAYCRWAGRRLPTEAEWEAAASAEPGHESGGIPGRKRRYPWGFEPPAPGRANLDWAAIGCVDASDLPAGDSAFGCRQMIGNVWEWTATDFGPYPGFSPGPYKEYSAPWFGDHKVLRGGCWATRSILIRSAYRNFYKPDRRDVWAGFRTCAL